MREYEHEDESGFAKSVSDYWLQQLRIAGFIVPENVFYNPPIGAPPAYSPAVSNGELNLTPEDLKLLAGMKIKL